MSDRVSEVDVKKRATRKATILSIIISVSVILIVVGIASTDLVGTLGAIVITQFGAILLGLGISELFFLIFALPDIVEKTILVTHGLDDPVKAVSHVSDRPTDQKMALTSLIKRMFGNRATPPDDLVRTVADFVEKHSGAGFYRRDYRLDIVLQPIGAGHALAEVRDRYYEAHYESCYEVENISGERIKYRTKLLIDNHDYQGVPHNQAVSILRFSSTRRKISDDTIVGEKDYLEEIRSRCPDKLRPLVSADSTVFIDLIKDPDPEKARTLDEVLTETIDVGEKLQVGTQWLLYLKKQDNHETSMSYFTKGFTLQFTAPKQANA